MAARLPLCGWELHEIDPSNDLEKPMTDDPKPITAEQFIGKLRRRANSFEERRGDHLKEADQAFMRRENKTRCNWLTLVPEKERPAAVTMAHALGLDIDRPVEPQEPPSESTVEAKDTPADGGSSRLGPPGPVAKTPRVEIDRSERKVPRQ